MKKFLSLVMLSMVLVYNVFCQDYYGRHHFGRLSIIDSNTIMIDFAHDNLIRNWSFDSSALECSYTRNGDTLFLSTNNSPKITARYVESVIPENQYGIPVVVHYYKMSDKGNYDLMWSRAYLYDTTTNSIVVRLYRGTSYEGMIVVDFGVFPSRTILPDRTVVKTNGDYSLIITVDQAIQETYLAKFPLLIQGWRIKPISMKANEKCWIDNGFYFPVLVRKKKNRLYDSISNHEIGYEGLCCPQRPQKNRYSKHRKKVRYKSPGYHRAKVGFRDNISSD